MIFGDPRLPLVLGVAGVLPFLGWALFHFGLLQAWVPFVPWTTGFFATYAAVILSFMAAIHWAWAMQHDRYVQGYFISIGFALAGWLSLSVPGSSSFLAMLFVVLFIFDRQANGLGIAPSWYLALRLRLTLAVAACLGLVAFL